jgi:hypothetical protein
MFDEKAVSAAPRGACGRTSYMYNEKKVQSSQVKSSQKRNRTRRPVLVRCAAADYRSKVNRLYTFHVSLSIAYKNTCISLHAGRCAIADTQARYCSGRDFYYRQSGGGTRMSGGCVRHILY